MKKKYSIFISSTKLDIGEHRNVVINLVQKKGHIPIAMEFFPSGSEDNKEYISERISECDLFISVVGRNVGHIFDDGCSFVEFELDQAEKFSIPVIGFACDEQEYRNLDHNPDLQRVRNRLLNSGNIRDFFSLESPDSVAKTVGPALDLAIDRMDLDEAAGWIRSKSYSEISNNYRLNITETQSRLLVETVDRIRSYSVIIDRSTNDIDEKKIIAKHFWKNCSTSIFQDSDVKNIFFEASSSCAYISKKLVERFQFEATMQPKNRADISYFTNSSLTFLQFLLLPPQTQFDAKSIKLFPCGSFSERYGEVFGKIHEAAKIPAEKFARSEYLLRPGAKEKCQEVREELLATMSPDNGLIFSSITGVNLNDGGPVGPLVWNYRNCLFKRVLYGSGIPTVLAIDGSKWDYEFKRRQHFPIFTDGLDWLDFLSDKPVAVIFTSKNATKASEISDYFFERGLEEIIDQIHGDTYVSIMFNAPFNERLKVL